MLKLSAAAKKLGVSKMTLWNWKYDGKIEFTKVGGLNFIDNETINRLLCIQEEKKETLVAIYCRVSSAENKTNLETQKERLINYCAAKDYKVAKIVTEFGSGLNDKRPKLELLLTDETITIIVVEHKDRLTRFGFNYIERLLNVSGRYIEVINQAQDEKEI